jgi:3-phosphoshikimate 1-carboxyvinyltransferase
MQTLKISKGLLKPKVIIPPSKSYANRSLILAAISEHSPIITNLPKASDVTNLLSSLREIGLNIIENEKGISFKNSFPACEMENVKEIMIGEGGTTARFLAVMLLLGKKKYTLKLGKRLKERPWDEFISLATSLGARVELTDDLLSIQGPVKLTSELEVDCSKTTQFASAFELISTVTKTKIIPINLSSSQSYLSMTAKLRNEFKELEVYKIPSDWSSVSYPMAFAALNQRMEFPDLEYDSVQADAKFFNILKDHNCLITSSEVLTVEPAKPSGSFTFNVSDSLDLVPALSYYLAHIEGRHCLSGIANLVHKESNRLDEVIKLLDLFHRKAFTDGVNLIIEGKTDRLNEEVNLIMPDDHRMVMTGTLFLLHHGGGTIAPAESVYKSYPDFFNIIKGQGF